MIEVMIDFTEAEQEIAEKYAFKQGITLEEAIKKAFFEKITREHSGKGEILP